MKTILLALVIGFCVSGCVPVVKRAKTKAILGQLNTAVQLYELEFGRLEVKSDGYVFSELCGGNRKKMMFIAPIDAEAERRRFLDAWNNPVTFSRLEDGSLQITSPGADGKFGGPKNDDISLDPSVRPHK